jgi:hypothetical protein
MPQQFIVGFTESGLEDVQLTIVNGENEEHALDKYARAVGIKEEHFIEYVYDRAVHLTLAENFWLREEHELDEYEATGRVMINDAAFRQRVNEFFGENRDYAERYLEYYYGNRDLTQGDFPEDMLIYIWFEAQWAEVLVAPLAGLPVIE